MHEPLLMLADYRAKLKAKFKFPNPRTAKGKFGKTCGWEVYAGDELLYTLSVEALCKADPKLSYETIATKEFGTMLIERTKKMRAYW